MPPKRYLLDELRVQFDPDRSNEDFDTVEAIARGWRSTLDAIDQDPHLTREGKIDRRTREGKRTLEALGKWWLPKEQHAQKHREQLMGEVYAAVTPPSPSDLGDRLEALHRRAEIRRRVEELGLEPGKVELVYRQGDAETRRALEERQRIDVGRDGGVLVRPFVSPELREEVLVTKGREAKPEAAEMIDKLDKRLADAHSLKQAVENEIRKAAPSAFEPRKPVIVA